MSFGRLAALADGDGVRVMQQLSDPEALAQFEALTCGRQLDADWMGHVVLAKLCAVQYQPLVVKLFCRVCRKQFLDQLVLHVVQMGAAAAAADFYRDFCCLCDGVVRLVPALACDKVESMVWIAEQKLAQLPEFDGVDSVRKELALVVMKLAVEKERLQAAAGSQQQAGSEAGRARSNARKFRFDNQAHYV
ncbi:hypothetical protein ONE63_001003 [Megalurothrips usitatus]|uniref:Uncharacterized protein n=1 Tax=Megalurothrips usitatus TaxID=439358 RepID=A0AAV7XAU7_9NEOP|nr:hypothetical protein ONE63_001003 [Megalurothrips usitatus]